MDSCFPRRILLAVTGLTPQVVTETLYALAVERQPPFIPTEIHLLTTAEGAEAARLGLLSADPGWFHRLCRDYELPAMAFDASHIQVLRDELNHRLLTGAASLGQRWLPPSAPYNRRIYPEGAFFCSGPGTKKLLLGIQSHGMKQPNHRWQ